MWNIFIENPYCKTLATANKNGYSQSIGIAFHVDLKLILQTNLQYISGHEDYYVDLKIYLHEASWLVVWTPVQFFVV